MANAARILASGGSSCRSGVSLDDTERRHRALPDGQCLYSAGYRPFSISASLTFRWAPTSGGVPVTIAFATSNSTSGCGLSTVR